MENLSEISRGDSDDNNNEEEVKRPVPGISDDRPKYAVKIIRARDEEYQSVALKEYYLLKQLDHPGVIKMVDAFVNKSSHTIFLVMELV